MKTYILILGSLFVFMFVQGYTLSPEDEGILKVCLKEVGLPEESMNKLEELLDFKNRTIRCLFACIIKNRGGMIDGKVTDEKDLELFFKNFSKEDKDVIKQNKIQVMECAKKANEEKDQCEIIGNYLTCGINIVMPLLKPK